MKHFKDHFSNHATTYAQYRPDYPPELFSFLAGQAPDTKHAWDCATGNGQAALALAEKFEKVTATDASEQQINSAIARDNVEYRVATAEDSTLPDKSMSLVTVAQALHWFDFDTFFIEVERVLKPGGVFACWTYGLFNINPKSDALIYHLYRDILPDYWPAERLHVEQAYVNIPFPFEAVKTPKFVMHKQWSVEQVVGYLSSWSAVKKYCEKNQSDPLLLIKKELIASLNDSNQISWPLSLVVRIKSG